jgi:hypothetical protein
MRLGLSPAVANLGHFALHSLRRRMTSSTIRTVGFPSRKKGRKKWRWRKVTLHTVAYGLAMGRAEKLIVGKPSLVGSSL